MILNVQKLRSSLSNNDKKFFDKKLNGLIGPKAGIALMHLKQIGATSKAEIEVIAKIISSFSPLDVSNFDLVSKIIILNGYFIKGHKIEVIPSFKVQNHDPKNKDFSIDCVLKLYRKIESKYVLIFSLAIEYDGHPSHFVESNIHKAYIRDLHISSVEGIETIRLYKKMVDKANIEKTKERILNILRNSILKTEKIMKYSYRLPSIAYDNCDLCHNSHLLAGRSCICYESPYNSKYKNIKTY